MIAHLRGTILEKTPRSVVVENHGVGYEVSVPLSTFYALPDQGEVSLHVHTNVREDAITLFGFQTRVEKAVFLLLVSISGIGPRLAVSVLSGIGPWELLEAIAGGDAARLRAIPGVGKKTAERIALELKDRAETLLSEHGRVERPEGLAGTAGDRGTARDAVSALVNLGYPSRSAKQAVEKAGRGTEAAGLEELIREALRLLS
jgi:Holliday junction DNA helicase RuvA